MHAILAGGSTRFLDTSEVVPAGPDGTVPEGIGAQTEVVWSSAAAIVDEDSMEQADIVLVATHVVLCQDSGPAVAA